jgi:hypothetical protein
MPVDEKPGPVEHPAMNSERSVAGPVLSFSITKDFTWVINSTKIVRLSTLGGRGYAAN